MHSAFTLGQARGVIMAQAASHGCDIREYAARVIKKGITGYGNASKTQMEAFVSSVFGIREFARDDVADALALALYGGRQWQLEERYQRGASLL